LFANKNSLIFKQKTLGGCTCGGREYDQKQRCCNHFFYYFTIIYPIVPIAAKGCSTKDLRFKIAIKKQRVYIFQKNFFIG